MEFRDTNSWPTTQRADLGSTVDQAKQMAKADLLECLLGAGDELWLPLGICSLRRELLWHDNAGGWQ